MAGCKDYDEVYSTKTLTNGSIEQMSVYGGTKRYIDVDKFAEAICNFPAIDEHSANTVIFLLRSQPQIDVEEVKYGYWIEYSGDPDIITCSECDWGEPPVSKKYKRCPMCGAIMDGGKKE